MCAAVYGNLELLTDIMKDNSSTGTMNSIMLFENPEKLSFLLILLINLF